LVACNLDNFWIQKLHRIVIFQNVKSLPCVFLGKMKVEIKLLKKKVKAFTQNKRGD
jgi:hypothetical protein